MYQIADLIHRTCNFNIKCTLHV